LGVTAGSLPIAMTPDCALFGQTILPIGAAFGLVFGLAAQSTANPNSALAMWILPADSHKPLFLMNP
jgi:hypothetical protein